ncbi:MAG: transcriptional repressor [Silvanigrellaceae bacterium]|nr:transcriptional repressor [Silvanigrellaceae bacterium]
MTKKQDKLSCYGHQEENTHQIFANYLAKLGLRQTRQRMLIFKAVVKSGRHVDVQAIAHQAKQFDSKIGVATIYRTLQLMTASGILAEQRFGRGKAYFEFVDRENHHHDHLICNMCGEIIEFFDEKIENLQEAIAQRLGFILKSHTMELFADCKKAPHCERSKQTKSKKERAFKGI